MFGARSLYPGSAELKVYGHEFLAFGGAAPFALKLPPEVLFEDCSDGDDDRTSVETASRVRLADSGMLSVSCRELRKTGSDASRIGAMICAIQSIPRHRLKPNSPQFCAAYCICLSRFMTSAS
jgi:hypothetical protein